MPNWTDNVLFIEGPVRDVARLWAIICPDGNEENILVIARLYPMPPEYNYTVSGSHPITADDGNTWYEWANEHWGVKWPDSDTRLVSIDSEIQSMALLYRDNQFSIQPKDGNEIGNLSLNFSTPWCAPSAAFDEIARRWPSVRFRIDSTYEDEFTGDWQEWNAENS